MDCLIYLTRPIGWNELGVIATVVAVIVALFANRSASQQLKSALKIHEQSKSIELLDKRMDLMQKVSDGEDVSLISLRILFNENEEIVKQYYKVINQKIIENQAEAGIVRYFRLAEEFGLPVEAEIERFEEALSRADCPEDVEVRFKQFCYENALFDTEGPDEYNYYALSEKRLNSRIAGNAEKSELLKLMEAFIKDSVKPIDEENA